MHAAHRPSVDRWALHVVRVDFALAVQRFAILDCAIPPVRASNEQSSFLGDGEWQARKHGVQGRRQWRKVHLATDAVASDIRAVEFAASSDGDSPVLPDLLDQIPDSKEIGAVTAYGASDTRL